MKILKNDIVTLLLFFFVGFLTFMTMSKNIIQDNSKYDYKPLDISNIKTGDLFLLSYNKTFFKFLETAFGFNFAHPSLAVWDNGELFIIEYAEYFKEHKGLIKIPFKDWIKYNKNATILKNSLSINGDSEREREILKNNILKVYENNKETYKNFSDFSNVNFTRFLKKFGKYDSIGTQKNITCTELIAFLVCESDIAQKTKALQYFQPSQFVGFQGFDLNSKYYCDENYIVEL